MDPLRYPLKMLVGWRKQMVAEIKQKTEQLRDRMERLLERTLQAQDPEALVFVSVSVLQRLHITLISRAFEGLDGEARDDLIWPALDAHFTPEELSSVGVCLLLTREEAQEMAPSLLQTALSAA
jgi:hypothetical protein